MSKIGYYPIVKKKKKKLLNQIKSNFYGIIFQA